MKRSTVVLLNPPSPRIEIRDFYCSVTSKGSYLWAPIDLLVASAWLREGFDLAVIDAIAERLSEEATLRRIRAARPSAVLSLTSASSYQADMALLRKVRDERPACRIVVCGNVALDPDPWVLRDYPWIDALLADFTSSAIADFLVSEAPGRVPRTGMVTRSGTDLSDGRGAARGGVLSFPVPRHDLFPLRTYRLPYAPGRSIATVISGYGCPYNCSFCIQSRGVIGYRPRETENLLQELRFLQTLDVRELYFRDPLFGADASRTDALCRALRDCFEFGWSCDSRVELMHPGIARLMKDAGCRLVAFGIETADDATRRAHGKGFTTRQAREAIRVCREEGLKVAGYFIIGLPGEGRDSVDRTVDFAISSGIDFASFSVASPDFGTPLRTRAIRGGAIAPTDRSFDRNRVSGMLSSMTVAELDKALRRAVLRFYARPSYALRRVSDVRSVRDLAGTAKAAWELFRYHLA